MFVADDIGQFHGLIDEKSSLKETTVEIKNLLNAYHNIRLSGASYVKLLMRKAKDLYDKYWDELPSPERDNTVDKIYEQAYAYRAKGDEPLADLKSKNEYNTLWLSRCIDEAIEECVIKIPTEQLMPGDPVEVVRRYLELKLFGEWKNVELNGKPSQYYINKVGDYYDLNKGKICSLYTGKRGYCSIMITEGKRLSTRKSHRDVARYFIPNDDPEHKTEVNHINGVKTCNAVFNLEWCNKSHNAIHAVNNGLIASGENRSTSKYKETQVREICQLLQDRPDLSFKEVEKITGVRWTTVRAIYQGVMWKTVSKDYTFPPRETVTEYTDDEIIEVCKILCKNPDKTYHEMEDLTGVDADFIRKIYSHKARPEITDKFSFPPRESHAKGERAGTCVYTEAQIRRVCELLRDRPDLSFPKIAAEAGTDVSLIGTIYRREHWTSVSKDYVFPPRESRYIGEGEKANSSKYSNIQIEHICELLDSIYLGKSDMRLKDISEMTGVSLDVVKSISRGRNWQSVAKNHVFYKAKFG